MSQQSTTPGRRGKDVSPLKPLFRPLQPPVIQPGLLQPHYRYREYAPNERLAPYVACFWTVEYEQFQQPQLHRIIPDGCIDIILDRRAAYASKGAFLSELMASYEALELTRTQAMFGIRFFAETVRLFLGAPVSAFAGCSPTLADLWGGEADFLVEEMLGAPGDQELIGIVERELFRRLHSYETGGRADNGGLLTASLSYLYASQGCLSIKELAEAVCYSERNLRRLFRWELGASPKELAQIIRFQFLLRALWKTPHARLTDVAQTYGYFDQPHLIKDFKRYYGLQPSRVFAETRGSRSGR
ncbi:helix-turn-helix transcriptional regulator [Brevibacillus brevis]|uniref:Helix-turn-helix transcriptional regulator n=1 Tax=Brevibacillus brevis TaxID=1393 RepID=A0ABY9T8L7_BREBE|nr:helix-turn-helix transcriptional regulator [Brevibacillus brevis]WNC16376.1 helix-turn-helix transcriptional regulator [Brevibacillus brevis]